MTVKLLLVDEEDRLLLIQGKDTRSGTTHWYPVGGGIEPGESTQEAAAREAYEETGLTSLPPGTPVWTRDHTYEFDGRSMQVHEDWSLHAVRHFDPVPAGMSPYEIGTIVGFRWWRASDLSETRDTVFPPNLATLLIALLRDGPPAEPVDITGRSAS